MQQEGVSSNSPSRHEGASSGPQGGVSPLGEARSSPSGALSFLKHLRTSHRQCKYNLKLQARLKPNSSPVSFSYPKASLTLHCLTDKNASLQMHLRKENKSLHNGPHLMLSFTKRCFFI